MLIRTQDKKTVLNMNNITRIFVDDYDSKMFQLIAKTNDGQTCVLGYYKSEVMARAVLYNLFLTDSSEENFEMPRVI